MPFTKKINDCVSIILTNIEKLNKSNISVVFAIHCKGEVHSFGNKHAKAYVKDDRMLKKELEKDILGLCNKEPEISVIRDPEGTENIDKLPAPLHLLKAKEAIDILRKLVCYEYNKKQEGNRNKRRKIIYGDENWEPRFWPNQIWKWKDIINFSDMTVADMKREGLGDVYAKLTDFFRDVIKIAFEFYGLDPETHISAEKFTKENEEYRKKVRKIKSAPRIINPAPAATAPPQPRLSEVFAPESEVSAQESEVLSHEFENFSHESEYTYRGQVDTENVSENIEQQRQESEPILSAQFEKDPENFQVDVPHCVVKNVWPNTKIHKNKKGSSSITRGAAQSLGLGENDFWKLRMPLNEIIIKEFEGHFQKYFTFPKQHETESGKVIFSTVQEYLNFLRTPASMSFYNHHEVELLALATLIGGVVHVLHQGGDGGILNLDERWSWSFHAPINPGAINKKGKYYTNRDIHFITEDNQHFYLLTTEPVYEEPAPLSSPASRAPEPGITDVLSDNLDQNIIEEGEEELDIERFSMIPIGSLRRAPVENIVQRPVSPLPSVPEGHVPSSEEDFAEDLNQTLHTTIQQNNPNDANDNDFIPLNASSPKTKSKKGEKRKGNVSGLRRSNRLKSKQNTIERLLKIPSDAEKEKEEYYMNVENQRKERMRLSAIEEAEHEQMMEKHRKNIEAQEQEADELIFLADDLRVHMTEDVIDKLMNENMKYFEDVKCGLTENWRHKMFVSPGTGQTQATLRHNMVGSPFTDSQQEYIWQKVKQLWELDPVMNSEHSCYISYVMFPTILIRLYQVYMGLDTFAEAERRVKNAKVFNHYESTSNDEL